MTFDRPLILDACCLINVLASGRAGAILRALPTPTLVTETVRALELRSDETTTLDALNPEGDQFPDLFRSGVLTVVDFAEEPVDEAALFLDYAADIGDDGEAASLAIASVRGYAVATDDKRARAYARRHVAHVPLVYTLEILMEWAPTMDGRAVAHALRLIESEGNYGPGRSHPHYGWWASASAV